MPRKFEEQYRKTLRRRVVKKYVQENARSPSRAQVNELMHQGEIDYPGLNLHGFSAVDFVGTDTNFMEESSSSKENVFRESGYDDLVSIDQKAEDLAELIEDGQRSLKATSARVKKLLQKIDRRLNNLLILSGRNDAFVYGVEETFDSHEQVDMNLTTASVEAGYATLGRSGYTKVDLSNAKFSVTPKSDKGIIGTANITGLSTLKEVDGDLWEYHINTNYATGQVRVLLNIDFDETDGIYIGDLRLTGSTVDSNSITTLEVYYSVDGKSFYSVKPGQIEFGTGENQFSIGIDGIKKIKIELSKSAADHSDGERNHKYIFSLDSIELFTDTYDVSKRSTLVLGPYSIANEMGEPVNFTMATLGNDTCCLVPRKSSVSFFLSKDKTNWFPVSYTGESLNVVQFNTSNPIGTYSHINNLTDQRSLFSEPPLNVDLEYGKDLICNLYISEDYSDGFVLRNTYVKRNIPRDSVNLYGVSSGWFKDKNTFQYKCCFQIKDIEGRFFDFGNTSAYIDGRQVTGTVHVAEGYHTFATSDTNWYDVEEGIASHTDLEEADPAYPFNHKLMIEGYRYPGAFQGARVYEGADEYFGSLLEYVSPEEFAEDENEANLNIYTVENYEGRLYFKVKADPSDGSWIEEYVKIDYMLRTEDTSDLYIKAIISTRDPTVTPNINTISVRVV